MTADRSPPRGRTAASNRTSRHRAHAAEAVDDGWPGELPGVDPRTKTFTDAARSAISRNG